MLASARRITPYKADDYRRGSRLRARDMMARVAFLADHII